MSKKINDQLKIKTILEKVESKLKTIAKDPDVIGYNYYNDSKFVGAKVMRSKKITLEQLAAKLDSFADVVMTKLDRLENNVELIMSLPTIKKEIEESKKKK